MSKKSCLILAACLLLALPAVGDTFDWSYAGSGISASGTFVTDPFSGGTWQITGITGERNGVAITGLGDLGGANNLLYPSIPYVDMLGLAYYAGGIEYNVYFDDPQPPTYGYTYDEVWLQFNPFQQNDTFVEMKVSPAPVPEPASLMLFGSGIVGLAGELCRKLTS